MNVILTSPWIPPEWIKAHGHEPRGAWWLPELGLSNAPLGAGICAFAQSLADLARAQTQSAVVFTTHCDQLRRGFDAVAGATSGRTFLFNLPATWQNPVPQRIFSLELIRLGEFLIELGGHPPRREELEAAVATYDCASAQLISAAAWCPARAYAEAIAAFRWDGTVSLPQPPPGHPEVQRANGASLSDALEASGHKQSVPLALVGGPLPRACHGLFDMIENAGGRVAVNATEIGEQSLGVAIVAGLGAAESSPSDFGPGGAATALAQRFAARCIDISQRPNTRFYAWLSDRLEARDVRGILLWHFVGCDLWRAEAQSLREAFGLPLLVLEPDEPLADSPRTASRVQAFLETLK